jgi:cellulose synthase/poly-beta-1,6-N-acetylglucosamine synthase-like glycosyltransferase
MISILLTAWKEEKTIGRAIETLLQGFTGDFELVLGCPDQETYLAGQAKMQELGLADHLVFVKDEGKGKPIAIKIMMDKAKGDIWILGDGDVWFGNNVIEKMLKHFEDPEVMAVTGRPVSADKADNMMGYYGHLLTDAAHHKRNIDLNDAQGYGRLFIKKRPFFPVSGYLFAMRKTDIRPPADTLVEDAYISTVIFNRGGRIAYEPEAIVYVKFPSTLSDYFKQKKRSVGGYVQLWKYGIVSPQTNTRSFSRELEYFWFPLRYAKSLAQLWWSLLFYPIRFWLWLKIFWERKILNKDFSKTWVRIETTK